MMKFIRLHNSNNNTVIIVSLEDIICIDTDTDSEDKAVSRIYLKNCSDLESFTVNETPEKIYGMIQTICKNEE